MYISLNSKKSNACPLHIASHDKELSTLKNSAARVYNNLNSKNKKNTTCRPQECTAFYKSRPKLAHLTFLNAG